MAKRNGISQSKHDQKVRELAGYFLNKGYEVYADIPGWGKPGLRNGYRPDVVAKSVYKNVIIEVETEDSVNQDKNQINAFRQYTRDHPSVEFKLIVV